MVSNIPNKLSITLSNTITDELQGKRLDQALGQLFPQYSRSKLQEWIKNGYVSIDGNPAPNQRQPVKAGQAIAINATIDAPLQADTWQPEAIPLDIIYEDTDIIIINKPIGLIVHPGAGHAHGTMLHALLHRFPELAALPRAGIIHRLDKDTSGLLVIARTLEAYTKLSKAIQARQVKREYEAIIYGVLTAGGEIRAPIGRHPTKRTHMAVIENDFEYKDKDYEYEDEETSNSKAREAITHYRVIERFRAHTHIRVMLETGRTHQIRVHMAHIDHPVVGDQTYGGRLRLPRGVGEELKQYLQHFKHQALHARYLGFQHPTTKKELEFTAPLPEDMQKLLELLREDNTNLKK